MNFGLNPTNGTLASPSGGGAEALGAPRRNTEA